MNDVQKNIEFTERPSFQDVDLLTEKINKETPEYGEAVPFGFFIKDDVGTLIAGVNGYNIYGAIEIDQLWVDKPHRGKGLARNLMDRVHALGEKDKCKFSTVQTMSFQGAEGFYRKLGYVETFKHAGYVQGSYCVSLTKDLKR